MTRVRPRLRRGRTMAAGAFALLTGAAACGGTKVKPAPPPLRPTPRALPSRPPAEQRGDCQPVAPGDGPAPLAYAERSIEEAENLANQGTDLLQRSARGGQRGQGQRLLEEAVHRFITALLADPYNVHATYNLAAAYARIGRGQCAVNLLARLVPLRRLPSLAPKVEAKLDRLLGRKEYRGRLDPDFFELRDDPRFRELVKNF